MRISGERPHNLPQLLNTVFALDVSAAAEGAKGFSFKFMPVAAIYEVCV